MSQQHAVSKPMQQRLDALQARHAYIGQRLDDASKHPAFGDTELRRLKMEKLRLKDEMEGLRGIV